MAVVVVLMLGLALPVLANDRCNLDRFKDRPICQTSTSTTTTSTSLPSTSSTAPSSTTSTLPTGGAIAGVGCSNTYDALSDPGGYLDQSSEDNLIVVAAGGHTVETWAENTQSSRKDPWGRYLSFRPVAGYTGVWFHLCERAGQLTTENVVTVLEDLVWANDPGIPVWLSPMNTYDGVFCSVTAGNAVAEDGVAVIAELDAMPNVHVGPDLGPLTSSMVRRDDCHPNDAGVALMGSQLVEFFDG